MNVDLFLSRHAEQWGALRRDPMWRDLLETIRTFDPCRAIPSVAATDVTNNAQHFLGRIAGFNLAVNVIEAMSPGPQHINLEATYSPEETQHDA